MWQFIAVRSDIGAVVVRTSREVKTTGKYFYIPKTNQNSPQNDKFPQNDKSAKFSSQYTHAHMHLHIETKI